MHTKSDFIVLGTVSDIATDRAALVEQVAHYKRLADDRGAEVALLSDKLAAAVRERDEARAQIVRATVALNRREFPDVRGALEALAMPCQCCEDDT